MKRSLLLVPSLGLFIAGPALADTVFYVDWTTANVAGGTASGVINVPGSDPITVDFEATFADGSPGNLFFAQTDGTGTNYWSPDAPYKSSEVENAPPATDILALVGGENQIYSITLSEPVKDFAMAVVSLGRGGLPITYDFDKPFEIVSQGVGFWGGSDTALQELPGDVLQGAEGHGTIQFVGTFADFSWEVPNPESWHGFTFGVRTTLALEPGPDPDPDPDPEPNPIPLPAAAWTGLVMLGGLGIARKRLIK